LVAQNGLLSTRFWQRTDGGWSIRRVLPSGGGGETRVIEHERGCARKANDRNRCTPPPAVSIHGQATLPKAALALLP
jgi:hypothetical protein